MKKILGALLILSMAIGGTVVAPNTIKDVQAAITIQSNRWYEGMTDGKNDQVYTYKMQGSGYFYYQVIPDEPGFYYQNGEFCHAEGQWIETSMIKNYKAYVNESSAYYLDGGYKSLKYSFKAGDTVTIKVKDSESDWRTHYKLKVTFVKCKNFEKENNNSKAQANKLKKGITYTGIVMEGDTDWFVFKAPKTKKYKIKGVNVDGSYSGDNFDVQAYKGYKRINYTLIGGGEGWKNIYSGKLKKGQKVYIKIKISDDYYRTMYKLKIK